MATDFARRRGRLRVTGYYEATVREDAVPLRVAFCHDWELAYGVAWRLTHSVGPAVRCIDTPD